MSTLYPDISSTTEENKEVLYSSSGHMPKYKFGINHDQDLFQILGREDISVAERISKVKICLESLQDDKVSNEKTGTIAETVFGKFLNDKENSQEWQSFLIYIFSSTTLYLGPTGGRKSILYTSCQEGKYVVAESLLLFHHKNKNGDLIEAQDLSDYFRLFIRDKRIQLISLFLSTRQDNFRKFPWEECLLEHLTEDVLFAVVYDITPLFRNLILYKAVETFSANRSRKVIRFVEILLKYGASPHFVREGTRASVLEYVESRNCLELITVFQNHRASLKEEEKKKYDLKRESRKLIYKRLQEKKENPPSTARVWKETEPTHLSEKQFGLTTDSLYCQKTREIYKGWSINQNDGDSGDVGHFTFPETTIKTKNLCMSSEPSPSSDLVSAGIFFLVFFSLFVIALVCRHWRIRKQKSN